MKRPPKQKSPMLDTILYGVEHDAFDDELGQALLRSWQVGAADETVAGLIDERVHKLKMAEAFGRLSPFRAPRLPNGEILLGTDHTGGEIRISVENLNAGLGFFGNTGSGKTGLLLFLLPQLAAEGVTIWVSEMYKRQLRQLRGLMEGFGQELVILQARNWKSNILQAGTHDPHAHLAVAVDVLVRVLSLPPRARAILRQVCYSLYEEYGIWNGRSDEWPCLYDVYERIRAGTRLNAQAREAILDRLGGLLTSLGPGCAAYRLAWTPEDLAKYSIDFEMTAASPAVQEMLLFSTLFSLLQHEVERGVVNQRMSQFTVFEDGQRLFDLSQHLGADVAPMDELAGVIRGTAKGIGVVVQTREGFSKRLLPNLANKIIGRLGSAEDYRRLGDDLSMNATQIEWARKNLRPGLYVAQLADAGWREPFILRTPEIRAPRNVTDDEAERSVRVLDVLPVKVAEEYRNWQPGQIIAVVAKATPPPAPQPNSKESNARPAVSDSKDSLSEIAARLLQAVLDEPGLKVREYAQRTGLNGQRTAAARRELVAAELLREHAVVTSGRGRRSIVLEPLEKTGGSR